jgi:hypothetical protein
MKKIMAILGALVTGGLALALSQSSSVLAKALEECSRCPALSSN